jgi:hypothetical protein
MSRKKFNPTAAQFLFAFSSFAIDFIKKYQDTVPGKVESIELKLYIEEFSKMMFDSYERHVENNTED